MYDANMRSHRQLRNKASGLASSSLELRPILGAASVISSTSQFRVNHLIPTGAPLFVTPSRIGAIVAVQDGLYLDFIGYLCPLAHQSQ